MRSWSVSARGLAAVQVRGSNWIVALGSGLEMLGKAPDVQRLACEVLPNGTVIARDISTGTGYVVQEVEAASDEPEPATDEELELLPADAIEYAERLTDAGADEIMCIIQMGTIPQAVCLETIRQWGEHVIPHFRAKGL